LTTFPTPNVTIGRFSVLTLRPNEYRWRKCPAQFAKIYLERECSRAGGPVARPSLTSQRALTISGSARVSLTRRLINYRKVHEVDQSEILVQIYLPVQSQELPTAWTVLKGRHSERSILFLVWNSSVSFSIQTHAIKYIGQERRTKVRRIILQ